MVWFFGDYDKKVTVNEESEKNGHTQDDQQNIVIFKGNLTDTMKIQILKNRQYAEQMCNKKNACQCVRYVGFTVYVMSVLYIMYYVLDLAFGRKNY